MVSQLLKLSLPNRIHKDVYTVPGVSPDAKAAAERLLEEDRERFHAFHGPIPFHNHLSHHILSDLDLGASAERFQDIYNRHSTDLKPAVPVNDGANGDAGAAIPEDFVITRENWTQYMGLKNEKYYGHLLQFFEKEVKRIGAQKTFEHYVFSPEANENGAYMVERFVSGAIHPLIQMGYALEFNSDAMVPQALPQASLHDIWCPPEVFPWNAPADEKLNVPTKSRLIFDILAEAHTSGALKPVPYDANKFLFARIEEPLTAARMKLLRQVAVQWIPSAISGELLSADEVRDKVRELTFAATVAFAGAGRAGKPPRLDFFLMHVLTSSHFIGVLLDALEQPLSKARLLASYFSMFLLILIGVGNPKLDPEVLMAYTDAPRAPGTVEGQGAGPWQSMLPLAISAGDSHVSKVFRRLYAASQRYGTVRKGDIPGAPVLDGTAFVRAAGAMMEFFGWEVVNDGKLAAPWDMTGLGWDETWQ